MRTVLLITTLSLAMQATLTAQQDTNLRKRLLLGSSETQDQQTVQATPEDLIKAVLKERSAFVSQLVAKAPRSKRDQHDLVRFHLADAKLIYTMAEGSPEFQGGKKIVEAWKQLLDVEGLTGENYRIGETAYKTPRVAQIIVNATILTPKDREHPQLSYRLIYVLQKNDDDKWYVGGCVVAREQRGNNDIFPIIDGLNAIEYLKILDK
jgi:hypothetical protein